MLTIGEFSRLSHVSARMLRHYDMLGLLRPAHMGENGYRYYDEAQLQSLAQIEALKGFGFRLAEIGPLLALDEARLAHRIHQRRLEAFAELQAAQSRVRRMEEQLQNMEATGMQLEKYKPIIMKQEGQRVFGIRKTIHIGEVHELFQQLKAEMKARGITRTGPTQQRYHGDEFNYESMDVEAQAWVAADTEGEGVSTVPGGEFLCVMHTGPYSSLRYAYDALCAWMARHPEYRVCGPAIERYIKDENETQNEEELETAVLFPVERV